MEMRKTYTQSKITFDYKEPTCRDRLKLSSDKNLIDTTILPYEKIIDLLDVKMFVDDKEYNLDTLPTKYFNDLFTFANFILLEMFKSYTEQEEEAKKSE